MKKIILAIAALFIAFIAACSNDYGSGTALNSGEGPVTVPADKGAADFDEPEIESSDDSEDSSSDSADASSSSSEGDDDDSSKK